jgi:hypothetical protein
MFTVKYRTYTLSPKQDGNGPYYDENEQIHGPFELVSKEQDDNGYTVVHAHRDQCQPGITFSEFQRDEVAGAKRPRSVLWVMNEQGATIAKYDL